MSDEPHSILQLDRAIGDMKVQLNRLRQRDIAGLRDYLGHDELIQWSTGVETYWWVQDGEVKDWSNVKSWGLWDLWGLDGPGDGGEADDLLETAGSKPEVLNPQHTVCFTLDEGDAFFTLPYGSPVRVEMTAAGWVALSRLGGPKYFTTDI